MGNKTSRKFSQSYVVIQKNGRSETLQKISLKFTRQIGDRPVKYFYFFDRTTNQTTSEAAESLLNQHDFYFFQQHWSNMWDPELPYANQINDTAKILVLSLVPA